MRLRDEIQWSRSMASGHGALCTMGAFVPTGNVHDSRIVRVGQEFGVQNVEVSVEEGVVGLPPSYAFPLYDYFFPTVPTELGCFVEAAMRNALEAGALGAWFGLEAIYPNGVLLRLAQADSIYGLASSSVLCFADDDMRRSEEWSRTVERFNRDIVRVLRNERDDIRDQ